MAHLLRTRQISLVRPLGVLLVCCALSFCVTGCLEPRTFADRYLKLTIESLSSETGHLQVKVTPCLDGAKAGDSLEQERAVKLRLGSELFYVPPSQQGTVDIKIYGYRSSAKQTVVQYARAIVTLGPKQKSFPAMVLREGRPKQEPFWCEPPAPIEPEPPPPFRYPSEVGVGAPLPRTSSLPPLGGAPPQLPLPPPPPAVPPSDVGEEALLRSPLRWDYPTLFTAASGRLVVLVNKAGALHTASISVIDVVSGYEFHKIELPKACLPSGLDVQGNIAALLCGGLGRLFFFTLDAGQAYGPSEGLIVGKDPVAVRMSGNVVVVANKASQHVLVMRMGRWSDLPKKQLVGESPSAIAAEDGNFYVASTESNSVATFTVDAQFQIQEGRAPYQVGKRPTGIAANGLHMVTANAESANITIWEPKFKKQRTLYLGGRPHAIVLLNHTAFVTDVARHRLLVVDLRAGRVSQSLSIQTDIEHIALTGEWLLMSSPKSGVLGRVSLRSRSQLVHFRVGAKPNYVHVAKGKALVHDPLAGVLNVVDLRLHQIEAQLPLVNDGWLGGTSSLLLHTTNNQSRLVIRSLKSLEPPLRKVDYDAAIKVGRVVTKNAGSAILSQSVYLLHQDKDDDEVVSFSAIHNLHKAQQEWRYEAPVVVVFNDSDTPSHVVVDILPWEENLVLIADKHTRKLYLVNSTTGFHQSTLELPSAPIQMVKLNGNAAVLLENGSLWIFKVQELSFLRKIRLAEQAGQVKQIRTFNGLIAYTDKIKGEVVFLEPETTNTLARFRVGCNPVDLDFWRNPADTSSWRHLLVVTNLCGESLSLYPLDLGPYTK